MNYIKPSRLWQEHLGFKTLTPIQVQTYDVIMNQRDLIARSQTGTGKSHAFLFPILDRIDRSKNQVQAIVLTPTRELALQLWQMASSAQEVFADLSIGLMVGGSDRQKALTRLQNNPPQLIIGSVGRVNDLMLNGAFSTQFIKTIVLDEADMIWEFGFLEDVSSILNQIAHKTQLTVFSATLPVDLQSFLRRAMVTPTTIVIDDHPEYTPQIDHYLINRKHFGYPQMVEQLLETFVPSGLLVFANSRKEVAEIASYLRDKGHSLLELHGDLSPRARRQVLTRIQNEEESILVCSDIAARGIDLPAVSHVISCGFPQQLEYYIHRSGRTGRMGKHGISIAIYHPSDEAAIRQLKQDGLTFTYKKIANKQLVDDIPFMQRTRKAKEYDPEIKALLNRKDVKVKPNYKKKRRQQIEKIQSRKRREMIRESIQKEKIKRAKEKQRNQ